MNYTGQPSLWRQIVRKRELLYMFLPCLLIIFIFRYLPLGGLLIAFKDFRMELGILSSPWCGWDNFRALFGSEDFPRALRNTLVISFLRLGFGFCAPIILALLINEVRLRRYARFVQTSTYLPHFFSWVVLGGMFLMIFSQRGPMNQLLALMGVGPIDFMTNDAWFITTLIATGIWQGVGYGAIIYLAALAGIDPTLYEAATVDGAGRWRQTLHITLPCLQPTIVVLLILALGRILNSGFDQIYNLYNPMVYDCSDILGTYVLRRLISMDFGLATAAGLFKSVVGLILVVSVNGFAKRVSDGEHGIW